MKYLIRIVLVLIAVLIPITIGIFGYELAETFKSQEISQVNLFIPPVRAHQPKESTSSLDFELEISQIGLRHPIEENVGIYSPTDYEWVLDSKIAHGKYSLLPTDFQNDLNGVVYLFAHREGDSNIFANLDKLSVGNDITIYYKGSKYLFKVVTHRIVSSSDTSDILNSNNQQLLRLQTCENGTQDRLLVDAVFVKSSNM